jgi:hypothetical protein
MAITVSVTTNLVKGATASFADSLSSIAGRILLGASPGALSAIAIDAASYSSYAFRSKNTTGSQFIIYNAATYVSIGSESASAINFQTGNAIRWTLPASFAADCSLVAGQVTSSIIGGATSFTLSAVCNVVTIGSANTLLTAASSTARSGFRLPSGTAPSSPTEGDVWYDGTNFKVRDSAATRDIATL